MGGGFFIATSGSQDAHLKTLRRWHQLLQLELPSHVFPFKMVILEGQDYLNKNSWPRIFSWKKAFLYNQSRSFPNRLVLELSSPLSNRHSIQNRWSRWMVEAFTWHLSSIFGNHLTSIFGKGFPKSYFLGRFNPIFGKGFPKTHFWEGIPNPKNTWKSWNGF